VGFGLDEVRAARDRIAPHLRRTPLLPSPLLSRRTGLDVWLKLESLQHTGSFKPRGALNKLMTLAPGERARGIAAASAGNHALGVAWACGVLGLRDADLFVQGNASPAKLAKLREYPVRVHPVGASYDDAQQAALEHAGRTGAAFAAAYDDEAVVAGQGSVGLEIVEDLEAFDAVVVPVGGGALSAGIAVAVKALCPSVRVIGVNAAASPSALLSFQQGKALDPFDHEPTLAHGLAGGYGPIPFAIARALIDEIVLVSEVDMKRAMAGVAAVLEGKSAFRGRVVIVVSGGNVDAATLREVLR
jgi:threonine dehydratase